MQIRTLIRAGFEPDIIAGTSIGAVVGGLYLAGKLDELEAWARSSRGLRPGCQVTFTICHRGL